MKKIIIASLFGVSLVAVGCGGKTEASATDSEEHNFQNPPKQPPPEATGGAAKPGGAPTGAKPGGPPPGAESTAGGSGG